MRLVVSGRLDNPDLATGYGIDEFEVWTAGDASRNVALATIGGRRRGASRLANDFADAYSAKLTIDGQFAAVWIASGPELTITLAKPERIERVVFSNNRGLDSKTKFFRIPFVGEYRVEVSSDGTTWTEVASSLDRRPMTPAWRRKRLLDLETAPEERSRLAALGTELARVKEQLAAITPLPSWWVGEFRKAPGPFTTFIGGDPQRKGDPVAVASPSMLSAVTPAYQLPADAPEADRRIALARWLVAPENPLTPRVLANRLWHYHFGIGIVDTPSDFGAMGSLPTHPELLDWLAGQLHAQGWRLKPLHRLIVTSAAYRQASTFRADAAGIDGDSRLLWRFPPRRLAAEEVRDTILCLAGRLDRRMSGPGYRLYRYLEDNVATYVPLDEPGPETYRRAVYHQNARASRADVLTDFDCPDFAFAAPRRAATTSPLQALTLMNHRFTLDMAAALAERLEREAGSDDPEAQVRRAFVLAYARLPDAEEVRTASRLVRRHGLRGVLPCHLELQRADHALLTARRRPPMAPDRNTMQVSSLIGRVLSRRGFLDDVFTALAGIGIAGLLGDDLRAEGAAAGEGPWQPSQGRTHFPARAQRVLQICCPGAASHIDLWDYKPALAACGGADARRGGPADLPGQERQRDAQPLAVRAHRCKRQADLGAPAAHGPARRRHRLLPRDDLEDKHARPRLRFPEHRAPERRIPQQRRLGQLRPGRGESRPADLRGTTRRPRRAPQRQGELE